MDDTKNVTVQDLTEKQIEDIKEAYTSCDVNHDGHLSAPELKRACRKLGIFLSQEEVDQAMTDADKDGNGCIDLNEFTTFIGKHIVVANYRNNELKKAFKRFDKDGDGHITRDEIRLVFQESGVELDDAALEDLVKVADTNNDGIISYEEFVHAISEKDWLIQI
ncbi:hypothetical protein CHS0354_016488 [Potamilus streckersoni]|uniref:Sulfhydryl light chain n=1 Tax=Potamilus streckersoni TaxID=2493646 RepID=A0AAE0TJK9_9BIVA|nr:hypothetical protein CHS0354_016488 [Potamilus streckersoni]